MLVRNDSNLAVNGVFSGLPEGANVVTGSNLFYITYQYNDPLNGGANDIALVAIPEPTTWALMGLSGAFAVYGYRRWRRRNFNEMDQKLSSVINAMRE